MLEHRSGTYPHSRLKRLATLTLAERPHLVVCIEIPDPHIRVLWGVECVIPSFTRPTPEDGKTLAFAMGILQGQLPTTIEVNPEWFQVDNEDIPTLEDLTQAIAQTAPGKPRIPEQTATSDWIAAPRASIAPFKLIHPLLRSLSLYPTSDWYLLLERASTLQF